MESAELGPSGLDAIAEEFSDAIRRGEVPSIDAYVAKYSDPSGQLRSLLESIAMIEGLKQSSSEAADRHGTETLEIDQLDDYKIVREIGRGGMGVVFEAIHQSLARRVALKVLANRLLGDEKHLARFRREARAAARLRHSNIVPVFGVGQSSGHHYYVMDFIDGMSLRQWLTAAAKRQSPNPPTIDEALASTAGHLDFATLPEVDPSEAEADTPMASASAESTQHFRWVAQLGATVCDALQYAHSQGVLHRDIKPANLLIDQHHDVWIADFGLAKLTELQAMTMTGDIVGTPQYMPPESFDGTYDVKSEVYGVGLTLYELLTQRPAIEGKSPADVIRKATAGVSVPPRRFNSRVPRDLETIVLKSLSHDPRARYVTAGELRDDLRRFLADRPIQARRTGMAECAIRWSRREPTVAMLTFAIFASLFALAVVSAVGYLQTKDALDAANTASSAVESLLDQRTAALQSAEQQRVRAEMNLQVALRAFEQIMQNITDRGIETDAEFLGEVTDTTSPNVTPDDAQLLQSLLGFFDELATNNSEDLLAESAVASHRAGEIYARLGQLRQADRAYTDALERYRKLDQRVSDNLDSLISQAEIMNELAVIVSLRGQLGRSNQIFDQTVELLENSDIAMESAAGRYQYARAHRLFASLSARAGLDESMSGMGRPSNARFQRSPIGTMIKLRTEEELAAIAKAITVLESLIEQTPDEVRFRAELARAHRTKAKVTSRARMAIESEVAVRRSIELFEQLLDENNESEAIRYELTMTLSSTEAFSFDQMLRARRADDLSTALLRSSPTLPRYQALKAHTLETFATHLQRIGKLDSAEQKLNEALRIYQSLITDSPELNVYETRRSQTLESMADLKIRQGDTQQAMVYLERAIRRLQPRLRRPNVSPVAQVQLQRMKQKLIRLKSQS